MMKCSLFMNNRLIRTLGGMAIALFFSAQAGHWLSLPVIERLDGLLYDVRLRLTAPGGVDPRIVIVDIDEKSLKEPTNGGEGRWPWPRNRLALLNQQLLDHYGVALVAYDVLFSEKDESSGIRSLEQLSKGELSTNSNFQAELKRLRPQLDYDALFAQSMKDQPVVLGFSFLGMGDTTQKGLLPSPALTEAQLPKALVDPVTRQGFTANLAILQNAAADGGHINPVIDTDGVIRRIPLLVLHQGAYYKSLALAAANVVLGGEPIAPVFAMDANRQAITALHGIDVGGNQIPVDLEIGAYVPYRGPYRSFQYLSAVDVMQQKISKADLEGKIILVGTTAPGLLDLRATPFGNTYPGVEIHANLLSGILDGTIKHAPTWVDLANLGAVLFTGLALACVLPWFKPLVGSLLCLGLVVIAVAGNFWLYQKGLVLPIAALLAALVFLYIFNVAYGYFVESRSKRLITGLFGQYVPPELVDEMAKDPASFSMEGESRELTILFSDVRGFTTISESLDAKTLSEFINAFLTPFTQVIYQNRGTIDKYMGDCIMAFWGAPIRDEEHARHGLRSAFAMLKVMEELNLEFQRRSWPQIKVGIGLNSGRVSVGNMGSQIRLAYTVMGDAVNLASRLEGITKEYGAQIVIGHTTREQLPDLVAREIDKVRVKGKDVAVQIYEPLGFTGEVAQDQLAALPLFEEALAAYRRQDWLIAEAGFQNLHAQYPQTGEVLYALYLERIAHLKHNPPGTHWDGAFTFTTK